ncbi:MAG TPA: hypothetical protein VEG35_02400, partial [Burkholderiales bacterium]|nr:hypothetical protein [Burkholderiales bacterium]
MRMRKPSVMVLAGLGLLMLLWLARPCAPQDKPGRVFSDVDPLRSVIILAPDRDERKETYSFYADTPMVSLGYGDGMARQHKALSDLLRKQGVRALNLFDLLEDAIANARKAGKLESALAGVFPDEFPRLKGELAQVTAAAVLGRD